MSTPEARQLAVKVARGILPYGVGCKQAAIRRAMAEFNDEYRRLVGDEKYLEVRDEYLHKLYHSLGLKYEGVDEQGEARPAGERGGIEALQQRIRESLEAQKKQRDEAAGQQRRLTLKAARVEREIANLPPFWFNALMILCVGGAFDGILFVSAPSRLWPLLFLFLALGAGLGMGLYDYLKFRRTVEALQKQAAELRRQAAEEAEKVQKCEQQLARKQAEFDLLCILLSRSFDLSELNFEETGPAPPPPAPETPQPRSSTPS